MPKRRYRVPTGKRVTTPRQAAASAKNLILARVAKHESVGVMAQQDKVAAKYGMSTADFKRKMAADRRKLNAEYKKQHGVPLHKKKSHGPGKGH